MAGVVRRRKKLFWVARQKATGRSESAASNISRAKRCWGWLAKARPTQIPVSSRRAEALKIVQRHPLGRRVRSRRKQRKLNPPPESVPWRYRRLRRWRGCTTQSMLGLGVTPKVRGRFTSSACPSASSHHRWLQQLLSGSIQPTNTNYPEPARCHNGAHQASLGQHAGLLIRPFRALASFQPASPGRCPGCLGSPRWASRVKSPQLPVPSPGSWEPRSDRFLKPDADARRRIHPAALRPPRRTRPAREPGSTAGRTHSSRPVPPSAARGTCRCRAPGLP